MNYFISATGDGTTFTEPGGGPLVNSYTFSNLKGGTSYTFQVVAIDKYGQNSPASAIATFTAQSIPANPTTVSAEAGLGSVTLTWTAPSNTGGLPLGDYKISAAGVTTKSVPNSTTFITIDKLTAGSTYTFLIRATNALGESPGAQFAVATVLNVPGAPTGVSANASGSSITASWVAPTSNGGSAITGYKVYLINSSGTDQGEPLAATSTTAVFTSVAPGTYGVKVVATNNLGDSARSSASLSVLIETTSSLLPNDPVFTPNTFSDASVGAKIDISAAAPSGGTVDIAVTAVPIGACTYSAGIITTNTIGECRISGTAGSTSSYASGFTLKRFYIVGSPQTITFAPIANQ